MKIRKSIKLCNLPRYSTIHLRAIRVVFSEPITYIGETALIVSSPLHAGIAIAIGNAAFGAGSGLIFLDNLECAGTEETLFECPRPAAGIHNCGRFEDSGVYCPGMACVCVCLCVRVCVCVHSFVWGGGGSLVAEWYSL